MEGENMTNFAHATDSYLNTELGERAFSRLDESDDRQFYAIDRFVSHLDEVALGTVEKILDTLIIEEDPVILDLMASWDSHIPTGCAPHGSWAWV
jgi:hypothetical protein